MTRIPAISVIVTARNVEKYIGRCLRSILDQSLPREDYEVIVVDDASSDRTLFALEVFGKDIRLVSNDERRGLPASLNLAIRQARGRYVVRLDGDDYVNREFLKILCMHLDMNPSIDAIACDYLLVDDKEEVLGARDCRKEPIACAIMFRTDQLIDVGLYDETFECREDEDLRKRFERKHSISRVQLPLYRYRRHKDNMTNDRERMGRYRKLLHAKHGDRPRRGAPR